MRASHALHLGFWLGGSTQHGEELCGLLNGGYGVVCGGEEPFLSDNNPESFPAHRPEGVLISFVITNIDDQRARRWPLSAPVLHQPAHGLPFVPPYVWSDFHHAVPLRSANRRVSRAGRTRRTTCSCTARRLAGGIPRTCTVRVRPLSSTQTLAR